MFIFPVAVQIYLYDDKGNTLAYSPGITILDTPQNYSGIITICIDCEGWTATGKINI